MAKLKDLEKAYLGHRFENGGGYTTKEYETFQRKYLNHLKALCLENGWVLDRTTKGHYYCSAFIKDQNGRYIYLSISDVRYWQDEWYKHILIRGAKNNRDCTGMNNNYSTLPTLAEDIRRLFRWLEWRSAEERKAANG